MSARSAPRTGSGPRPLRSSPRSVYVIGGFLGSGKTTLLKRLLAREIARGVRPAVIMNEYGERNVDSAILHEHCGESDDLEMRELLNGCICCDLSGDLSKTLSELSGRPGGPIFVETTGLAEIRQVVAAVSAAPGPASNGANARIGRPRVVTVLDGPRFRALAASDRSIESDVRVSDVVLINKLDRMTTRTRLRLERRVRALNPRARILSSTFGEVDPIEVLEAPSIYDGRKDLDGKAGGAAVDSSRGYASVTCEVRGPVDVGRLKALLSRYGRRIVRLKGFIRVPRRRGVHEVQWVPGALDVRASKRKPAPRPHLIIIGRNVDWNRFFEKTADCVVGGARGSD
jgi:G3E family GTPase